MPVADPVAFVLALAREHREPEADVLLARDQHLTVKVLNGRVENVEQATALGLGIRVVREGRSGVAFTERLEPEALERAFRAAQENVPLLDPTEVVLARDLPAVADPETLGLFNPELEALGVEELGRFGLEIEAAARAADPRVKAINHLMVSRHQARYRIASTHGIDYTQRSNSVGASCAALLEAHGQRKSGSYGWHQRRWEPGQARAIGQEAVGRGAALLGARPLVSQKLPLLLDEECAPQLLGMYLGCFHAEAAQKGQSRLKGRLGEPIADPTLTLTDEPHRLGAPGSRYLDAEGTATAPMALIERGRFVNFQYHIESARKEGRASTGHAGRSYSGGIGTRAHNLVIPTGEHPLEALIALEPRCLLVTELEGGAGCNPISGDISIGVQGFLIERGRRVQPVDSITIAGNFFDLLRQIRARGNAYQPQLSSLFVPPLLVEGLSIAG